MKLAILIFFFSMALFSIGCTSIKQPPPEKKLHACTQPKKNPLAVTIFAQNQKPTQPYHILHKEKISKYNAGGIKRQEAHLRDVMRVLAANHGGDAIMNLTHDDKTITGIIIAYQENFIQKTSKV